MLVQLHIENFALIDHLVVEFGSGLNILTGETGAGKSMIIGALGLVLGQRAPADVVRAADNPTLVEALFDIRAQPHIHLLMENWGIAQDEPYLLLKRLITKKGSRCYINANLATLTMLQEIGQQLVEILGQHQHQTLLRREHQLALLDAFGKLSEDVITLRQVAQRYHQLTRELQHLQQEEQQRLQRLDLIRFQLQEIDAAHLQPDEEERLSQTRHLLLNAEKLYELSQGAYAALYRNEQSVLGILSAVLEKLTQLAALDTRQVKSREVLQESYYTLEEMAETLRDYSEHLDIEPHRLQAIEDRLSAIAHLKRKYGTTIADVLQYRDRLRQELHTWERREERLEELSTEVSACRQELKSLAITLSDKRRQTAERLQQAVQYELQELNMAGTVFQIGCHLRRHPQGDFTIGTDRVALTADGIDEVEYLFAANAGQPLKPLTRIVSGGELSRVMLALKSILVRQDHIPTLILDEVDTGIGGRTAKIVGEKLRHLARSHQIFCITHLPQIASHGDQHFRVEKVEEALHTTIRVQVLDFAERIEEIARMSGGKQITATTRKHAEEMLIRRP